MPASLRNFHWSHPLERATDRVKDSSRTTTELLPFCVNLRSDAFHMRSADIKKLRRRVDMTSSKQAST